MFNFTFYLVIMGIVLFIFIIIFSMDNHKSRSVALKIYIPILLLAGGIFAWLEIKANKEEAQRAELTLKIEKAIDDNEYGDAYNFYNELEALHGSYDKYNIIKHEALFLVSQNTEESANRILFLLSQEQTDKLNLGGLTRVKRKELVIELYSLAQKINNQFVIEKLKADYEEYTKENK